MDKKTLEEIKSDLADELRLQLVEFHALEKNKNATARDFSRLSAKIRETCRQLDALDGRV